ncbi:hypothetical protein, partial [Mycobacterium sp.]|uniref:hypothetical protein n=1 Tax=Mycobacterium sp. TaxID=1785 RepID=UPI002BEA6348
FATRLLSVISGAIAVQKARFAAAISTGVEVGAGGAELGAAGAADVEDLVRSMMPTTSAAVASTIASATAAIIPLLRRGGGAERWS